MILIQALEFDPKLGMLPPQFFHAFKIFWPLKILAFQIKEFDVLEIFEEFSPHFFELIHDVGMALLKMVEGDSG